MLVQELDAEGLKKYLTEEFGEEALPAIIQRINTWIERGDGVSVYENHDMGHSDIGMKIFLSFGSQDAQITKPEPPESCPVDGPWGFGWRYQLVGIYKGTTLDL